MRTAIVESGGKQYRAVEGSTIDVDRLAYEIGKTFNFERCLLYTSPSPRDRTRSRMPSSA